MEALKAFAPQVTTSKVRVRAKLLQDLLSCSHLSAGISKPPGGNKGKLQKTGQENYENNATESWTLYLSLGL